jgi:hypothetical protein
MAILGTSLFAITTRGEIIRSLDIIFNHYYDDMAVSGLQYRNIESSGIGSNLVGHRLAP